MDFEGNMVIPAQYDGGFDFSDGLAIVAKSDGQNGIGSVGFINKAGEVVIPFGEYDVALPFSEGVAAAAKYDEVTKQLKWGVIDKLGKVVVPFEYDEVQYYGCQFDESQYRGCGDIMYGFSDEVIPVGKKNTNGEVKWGVIDKEGKTIIPLEYDEIYAFIDGYAMASFQSDQQNYWGPIDKSGNFVSAFENGSVDKFGNSYSSLERGNWCAPGIEIFRDGLIHVIDYESGKYGYANREGKLLVPSDYYDRAETFRGGMACVAKKVSGDCCWGFINTMGEEIVPLEYDNAGNLGSGGWVMNDYRYGFFNNPYWGQEETTDEMTLPLPTIAIVAGTVILVALITVVAVKRKRAAHPVAESDVAQETTPASAKPVTEHNFCMACGSPLPEGCRFCPKCGKEVKK